MTLNDDAVKIVLNTKGTIDDVSPEMKRILETISRARVHLIHSQESLRMLCSPFAKTKIGGVII